jgi:hypothetical protein
MRLYQPDKSAVAEHSIELGYWIKFSDTEVLAKTMGCVDWLIKEAIEIQFRSRDVSREEGFSLILMTV